MNSDSSSHQALLPMTEMPDNSRGSRAPGNALRVLESHVCFGSSWSSMRQSSKCDRSEMDKKMPCCSVQQGPFEFPVYSGNFRYCCRNVTVPNRRHGNFRASSSRTDHAISWFVPDGSQGDHGMNHCFRPLACLLTLVMFAAPSSEATAARHKQTSHAKKGH